MKHDASNWSFQDYELFVVFKLVTPGPYRSVISLNGSNSSYQIDGGIEGGAEWWGNMRTSNFGNSWFDDKDNTGRLMILSYTSDVTNQTLSGHIEYEEKFSIPGFTGFDSTNVSLILSADRYENTFSSIDLHEVFAIPIGNRFEAVTYLKKKWSI